MSKLTNFLTLRHTAETEASKLPALMLAAERAAASVLHGEHTQRKPGGGEKFWQYREYVPGDRPQDIDWRQSAKNDRVYTRQREWQTTQTAIFWCADYPGMDFRSDKSLQTKGSAANILTLALAILLTRAGEQIGIYGHTRTGRSELALQRLGEELCASKGEDETLPSPRKAALPKNTTLIQVGDFLEPLEDIEQTFQSLSSHTDNGLVIQILDPAEIDLPYSGNAIFESPADRQIQNVQHVRSIRDQYHDRIQNHLNGIEAACKKHGWTYILHRTDTPIVETLSTIWQMTEAAKR